MPRKPTTPAADALANTIAWNSALTTGPAAKPAAPSKVAAYAKAFKARKAAADAAEFENMLAHIAAEHLGIYHLEVRNSDRLDFHDVGVASLRDALAAAYELGRKAGGAR